MGFPSNTVSSGIAAVIIAAACSAQAATYSLTYAFTEEIFAEAPPHAASLKIRTANSLNSIGGFDVLDIRGNVDGDPITSLLPNPDPPNTFDTPDGAFFYNNVFFPERPVFDGAGMVFNSNSFEYNIFSNPDETYTLAKIVEFAGAYSGISVGTLDVAQIPLPAGILMIVAGFGVLGAVSRWRLPARRA